MCIININIFLYLNIYICIFLIIIYFKNIFGISKCIMLIIKLKNFLYSRHYNNPIFNLVMYHLPNNNQYIFLRIPFNESLKKKK